MVNKIRRKAIKGLRAQREQAQKGLRQKKQELLLLPAILKLSFSSPWLMKTSP
jgi:hypothetical protein